MDKLIRNDWRYDPGEPFARARILSHEVHPEGLDVERVRFFTAGELTLNPSRGHIVSFLSGSAKLHLKVQAQESLDLEKGIHLYIPPGLGSVLEAEAGTELLCVCSPSAAAAAGKKLLLRDEAFLAACASGAHSFRWILTPQYLSRRIFLRHDATLLSRSGQPVSWFHTTMFDVLGLPPNAEGEPVFKMSYNSRTEVNVCYDVAGKARVRMALHPYRETGQLWGPWSELDGEATYHLNEPSGGPEEERHIDEATQMPQTLRNKHEVSIVGGHVSLFCLFDPAPVGIERHQPGEYSDYEPLPKLLGTKLYENYLREIVRYDEMVDRLSLARARGMLKDLHGTPVWELYLQSLRAQMTIEEDIMDKLALEGRGRERILARWLVTGKEHKHGVSVAPNIV
ncbi:MAG: hypothetical protein ACM3OC_01600 [Deltaproteobacteria bacterium]